ncbi:hypothetical protein LJB98_05420 [Bacteroidales bacterium OttesenSCG-928-M11]|nr:hypothetical protein [Bacteroidales bacterium OttesenSCG-928-M11]
MTIAVDFDGTIVEHDYPRIGKPIPFAIDVLKKLQEEEGHTLILWTVREGELLQEAINYCESQGLVFYSANKNYPEEEYDGKISRKLGVDLFIDDRNVGGLPDWGYIYQVIKSGNNSFNGIDRFDNERPEKKNWMIRFGEAWDKSRGRRY